MYDDAQTHIDRIEQWKTLLAQPETWWRRLIRVTMGAAVAGMVMVGVFLIPAGFYRHSTWMVVSGLAGMTVLIVWISLGVRYERDYDYRRRVERDAAAIAREGLTLDGAIQVLQKNQPLG
jgi:uncharacterized membrane protein